MGDPRPTARELVHAAIGNCATIGDGSERWACDAVTAAIERDRAASDAREDRLREALEPVAISTREPNRCGVCHWLLADCADAHCRGYVAREALAAIPPRSDR